jgi:hypothetical protein
VAQQAFQGPVETDEAALVEHGVVFRAKIRIFRLDVKM